MALEAAGLIGFDMHDMGLNLKATQRTMFTEDSSGIHEMTFQ